MEDLRMLSSLQTCANRWGFDRTAAAISGCVYSGANTHEAGSERRSTEPTYFFELPQKLGVAQNLQSYSLRVLLRSPGDLVSGISFHTQTRPEGPPSTNVGPSSK
jgi:hypothetical protein